MDFIRYLGTFKSRCLDSDCVLYISYVIHFAEKTRTEIREQRGKNYCVMERAVKKSLITKTSVVD